MLAKRDGDGRCATLPQVRAVVLNSFIGLDGLELSEVTDPTTGDGEHLERFRDAYARLERGGLHGKIVLTP